jgi:hypothetical protein
MPKDLTKFHIYHIITLYVVLGCLPYVAFAGTYTDSSHGDATDGVKRTSMTGYSAGNCGHCHEQHMSLDGQEPDPTGSSPDPYLGFDVEEDLCQGCHGSGGLDATGNATDIQTDITKTNNHDLTIASGIHRVNETLADISTSGNAHVECTDCHNPHEAQGTVHTEGNNAIGANSPLLGVNGAEPTAWPTWATPAGGTYNLVTADKEYEVCFKCHSSAMTNISEWNTDNTSWTVTTGAGAWTDTALEFNPANASLHPISTGLTAAANTDALDSTQLLNAAASSDNIDWQTNAGTQTMYCSDCHASDSTAPAVASPHGSAVKWMLTGDRKAWPYYNNGSGTTYNGTSNTDPNRNNVVYWSLGNETSGTGINRLFCLNCHPTPTGDHHTEGGHRGSKSGGGDGSNWYLACVDCHIRVPHGGKVRRLIAADSYPAGGNMPDRYYPDGNGSDKINRGDGANLGPLENFNYEAGYPGTQYGTEDCGAGCYSDHNYSGTAADEQW